MGEWLRLAARITVASSDYRISSSNDVKAWEISGLIDAIVRVRNSVPYLCLIGLSKST